MDDNMEITEVPAESSVQSGHPWLDIPESTLDEDLRYTLDEIRFE